MKEQLLNLQNKETVEEDVDMVDGARFSTLSESHCGNRSMVSTSHC